MFFLKLIFSLQLTLTVSEVIVGGTVTTMSLVNHTCIRQHFPNTGLETGRSQLRRFASTCRWEIDLLHIIARVLSGLVLRNGAP